MELIWNDSVGIKSIFTRTLCAELNFEGKFQENSTSIRPDGSVVISHQVVNSKRDERAIEIRVNEVDYKNEYINAEFKPKNKGGE